MTIKSLPLEENRVRWAELMPVAIGQHGKQKSKSKLQLSWSLNNSKLEKTDTASFNLPAFVSADGFKVCPMAGTCAAVCYARQGRYMFRPVREARERNLAVVRGDLNAFTTAAIADLAHIKHSVIRVHDSGDFFSQAYLDAWFAIARVYPSRTFYAYTKSLHLDYSAQPENFRIVQSMGGKLDHLIDTTKSHSHIFATVEERIAAGYVDGNADDMPAIRGDRAIGLVYHGSTKLTEKKAIMLRQVKA